MLDSSTIERFGKTFRGELIGRTSAKYDAARALHNGMIDKRPLLIARLSAREK